MLLNIEKLKVEARGEEGWTPILHGADLQVAKGEVVGLIGESGAGKSTLGLAALGFAQGGLRFAGGRVIFDGTDLLQLPERQRRAFRGRRVAYVAQSAAASFNPAWRLLDQFCEGPAIHHTAAAPNPRISRAGFTPPCTCPIRRISACAFRTRSRAGNCSGRWSRWPWPASPT